MKKVLVRSKVDSKSLNISKGDTAKSKKKLVKKNIIEERFTLAEVSDKIKIPVQTLYKKRSEGAFPRGKKIGKRITFSGREINDWLRAQE